MEFKREKYVESLRSRRHNGLIKVITGSRRAGKSYIMNELFYRTLLDDGISDDHIIRFAFDADEDIEILDSYFPEENTKIKGEGNQLFVNAKKFRAYIREKTESEGIYYLLLDEVQLLEAFVGTLNGFLRHKNLDVYVTGSNSRFLSSDIATEFNGRGSEIHVLPLSFEEYRAGLALSPQEAWKEYIETGGIPLVALMQSRDEKVSYLKNLCQETYLKDIIQRNKIKKTSELSELLDVVASLIGAPVNVLKLTNTFQSVTKKSITDDTVSRYIECFEEAFIVSKAKKYSIKGRKYIGAPFKLYFEDPGVRNARLNFRQIEESHLMENVLYNELRYRGFSVDVGTVEINEKTNRTDVNGKAIYAPKELEVDFVASKGSQRYYIQSALALDRPEKEAQEKRSLYSIDDSFKKIVITKDGLNPRTDDKGITVIDLFDFLMDESTRGS